MRGSLGKMLTVLFVIWSSALCIAAPATDPAWEAYKTKFGKKYAGDEDAVRYGIWKQKLDEIEQFNAQYADTYGYTKGINQFSDMSWEEFKETMLNSKVDTKTIKRKGHSFVPRDVSLPDSIDWRKTEGVVTPVMDQGHCASGYAFSATGAIEGQWFIKKRKRVSLSEQQIVECSKRGKRGNNGCIGGNHDNAFKYIQSLARGIESERDYPYKAVDYYSCSFERNKVVATINGFDRFNRDETTGNEKEKVLKELVAQKGPVSVSINPHVPSFQDYESGVYNEPKSKCTDHVSMLDHHMLVVGYGTDDSKGDYWLVKNSYGTSWGEDGYIRMRRNKDNMCGIATQPTVPIV